MSRNGSGTYSLPAGQPVVTGTVISASTFNTLTSDLSTEITDSLSRSAKGAMLGILQLHDGASATVPDLTWSGDIDTGLGHSGANILDIIAGGTTVCAINASGFGAFTSTALISTTVAGSSLSQTTADTALIITGNRSAASTGNADVRLASTATRTAGNLLDVVNNATTKLSVDFAGMVLVASGPTDTATSPGPSAYVSPTLDANKSAANGLRYWKDPFGTIRWKGGIQNTGVSTGNLITSNKLPAGFRPSSTRMCVGSDGAASPTIYLVVFATDGSVTVQPNLPNSTNVFFDNACYPAEA